MDGLDPTTLEVDRLIEREWLITNGIGGYAASSIPGLNTRKYHGLLVAAMAPPVRRMVLLSRVEETVFTEGEGASLACSEYPGTIHPTGHRFLRAFNQLPFPRWAYQGDGWTIEKCLRLLHGENTVCLSYTLLGGTRQVTLALRPLMALRGIHELTYQSNGSLRCEMRGECHHLPATSHTPEVFFAHDGEFEHQPLWYLNTIYRREPERGYSGLEDLWTPGVVRWTLQPGQAVHFVCSADPIELDRAVSEADRQVTHVALPLALPEPHDTTLHHLVRAANQFVPASRGPATMVTQYPWAAPSVRDALIAFPGVLLVAGHLGQAGAMLEDLASRIVDGVVPSDFPENGDPPVHHGADVSLWFINAMYQYLRYGGEMAVVKKLYPVVSEIIHHHRHGMWPGVGADRDSLLSSRDEGVAASWMDAGVQGLFVTPRAGKPVELNALWYNAISIAACLADQAELRDEAENLSALAVSVRAAFNRGFWSDELGYCFDVLDETGNDATLRPNQLLAISLPFSVLAGEHHGKVIERVRSELLTPLGVRTLSPRDPRYCGRSAGNVVQRDRAAHQGSAYPWLLGAYVSAFVKLNGRSAAARSEAFSLIEPCLEYLTDAGMGRLCDLFDGASPHHPGGAIASARAIGELLRCYVEDILDLSPTTLNGMRHLVGDIVPARVGQLD